VLLHLQGIAKSFVTRRLFEGVDLAVQAGDRVGLVGPNGAGKTTLLRIAAGLDAPDAGRRVVPRGRSVALLRQEIDPGLDRSVWDEVRRSLARVDRLAEGMAAGEREIAEHGRRGEEVPASLAERYDRARHAFETAGGFDADARVERTLEGLGFDGERRGRPLRSFSGGWLMRVELAKLLLAEPDVLLLDEPTNHLDLPSIQWFEETLARFPGGVVVVSHDRTFLARHVNRVAELEAGRFTLYELPWERYRQEKALRQEQLLAQKRTQDRKIAQTERFIERFRYKNTKARQVQSRVKALSKLERVEVPETKQRRMRLRIPAPERAGAVVCTLGGIHKRYGDNVVYRGVDLQVGRGDRVALVGPNGAGKSTLLRIVAGVLPPDEGERALGHRARVAFYAQHQLESLDPARSVLEELASVARTEDHPRLRGHLGAFLFSGDDVDKRVSVLSGGEKARLALAKLLLRPANFLVLDEPTNHLDVDACEVLEDALRDYRGTLVFISHDRRFINSIASKVVEVRAGRLREFPGSYDDYLARAGPEAVAAGGLSQATGGPAPAPRAAAEAPPKARRKADRQREREERKARERARRRLERTEAAIEEREKAMEALGWRLGDPELYRDPERRQELAAERSALETEVAALYREWEALASELEEPAGDA